MVIIIYIGYILFLKQQQPHKFEKLNWKKLKEKTNVLQFCIQK